jgi:hypothetical protein
MTNVVLEKNRSTTDQIFAMRQILDKCYEYDADIHIVTY